MMETTTMTIDPLPKIAKNPHRIKVREVAEENGFDSVAEMMENVACESVVPACCDQGCQVEPDGRCEHGCPSVLLALGMI